MLEVGGEWVLWAVLAVCFLGFGEGFGAELFDGGAVDEDELGVVSECLQLMPYLL